MGAVRGDVADILADEVVEAGRRRTPRHHGHRDRGPRRLGHRDPVRRQHRDRRPAGRRRRHPLEGPRDDRHRGPSRTTVGMGIWRTVAKRPAEMDCSELYYGGPKYKAGYTPISDDLCYAFLLEEQPRPLLRRRAPERRAAQGARPGVRRHLGPGARQPGRRRDRQLPVDRGDLRRVAVVPRPLDHHRRRRARLPAADRAGRGDVRRGRRRAGRDADHAATTSTRCCRRSWSAASRA